MKAGITAILVAAAALLWWLLTPTSVVTQPEQTSLASQVPAVTGAVVPAFEAPLDTSLDNSLVTPLDTPPDTPAANTVTCEDTELVANYLQILTSMYQNLGGDEALASLSQLGQQNLDDQEQYQFQQALAEQLGLEDWELQNYLSYPLTGDFFARHYLLRDTQANQDWIAPIAQYFDSDATVCHWGACLLISPTDDNASCWSDEMLAYDVLCREQVMPSERTARVIVNALNMDFTSLAHELRPVIEQACPGSAAKLVHYQTALPTLFIGLPYEQPTTQLSGEQNEFVTYVSQLLLPHWPNAEGVLSPLVDSSLAGSSLAGSLLEGAVIDQAVQEDILNNPSQFSLVYSDPQLRQFLRQSLEVSIDQPIICGKSACLLTSQYGYEYEQEGMLIVNQDTGERYYQPYHKLNQAHPALLAALSFCQPIAHNGAQDASLETLYLCR